ncbi:hypothetical protein DICPUDRAFT_82703 [Dictyostelium purpureum]|uniref:AMP-dependent synthetase/ligase domain-containing protein n=1 Tax=Dictyostelium purpureum TaxID=5786 RepID=F0ZXB7_DICPU|nr:uncharacterized protein DICPUDRAFT_82703 [Dictyostelium purpureum]EGC31428.1 hypothetical protein DICPUDRAFT_82703 [Dictyostelium purpureum]|eukprot:XP_003292061.1 hypothetical protein DICPUDRAFT_82703 [Dictyostelium purpureum]
MAYKYQLSKPFNYFKDKEFSNNDLISFWDEIGKKYIKWDKMYTKVYSGNEKKPQWYNGGLLNLCNNVLDKNLKENGNKIAFYHECPSKNYSNKVTYFELWEKVCVFSRVLKNLNIKKGDVVMILMPNQIETIVAMLSCVRIGAIYCTCPLHLNSKMIADKIEYIKPKLIISTNYAIIESDYLYLISLLNDAILISNLKIENIIIYDRIDFINKEKQESFLDRPQNYKFKGIQIEKALDWDEICKNVEPLVEYELLESSSPVCITFSSGTTGVSKGFITETGSFIAHLGYSYKNNYGFREDDILFASIGLGWAFGQNTIFGSLNHGCSLVLYEGNTGMASFDYYKLIEKYKISLFLCSPLPFRLLQNIDPEAEVSKQYNLSSLRVIVLGGEILDSSILNYIEKIGVRVMDMYGQSECFVLLTSPSLQLPSRPKSAGVPTSGLNLYILSLEDKQPITKPFQLGEFVVKLPLTPFHIQGLLYDDEDRTLLNEKYLKKYPGYFNTGDLGYFDNDGYYYVVSRADDVINSGNGLIYNSFFEDTIQYNEKVFDNVVVPVTSDDPSKQDAVAFIILNDKFKKEYDENPKQFLNTLKNEINNSIVFDAIITAETNASIKHVAVLFDIPKSTSNKKIRSILAKMFEEKEYFVPSSMTDIHLLPQYENQIKFYKSL